MMVGQLRHPPLPTNPAQNHRMKNDAILAQISEFCRHADMAESTFGRRAVNDGKLVHRLREGKRITIDTLDRIQAFIAASMPGGVPPPRGLEVPPEKRVGDILGLSVKVDHKGPSGTMHIKYRDLEQLDEILRRLDSKV